jgi:hypothetical protein
MKGKFLLISILFFCQIFLANADDSHVGDIRYSILSEDQFIRLHGAEWEPLGGQAVRGDSELREYWGDRNLPDARGVFLRSANHHQDASIGNPDGDVGIGHYQKDQIASHTHLVHMDGNLFISRPRAQCEMKNGLDAGGYFADGPHSGVARHHAPQPAHFGGTETRPRNITVNTFVKVRESAPALNRPEISAEWVTQLFSSTEFIRHLREAMTNTLRSMM